VGEVDCWEPMDCLCKQQHNMVSSLKVTRTNNTYFMLMYLKASTKDAGKNHCRLKDKSSPWAIMSGMIGLYMQLFGSMCN